MRFDGTMKREQRETVLYNFEKTNIQVLIIQINAGGVVLNLQHATRVYIVSPTWNPCAELQAIARSYRLGQDHVVKCIRLVIENTIEERIMDIQENKLYMISDKLDDDTVFEKMGFT